MQPIGGCVEGGISGAPRSTSMSSASVRAANLFPPPFVRKDSKSSFPVLTLAPPLDTLTVGGAWVGFRCTSFASCCLILLEEEGEGSSSNS